MAVQTSQPTRMSRLGIFTSRAGPSKPGPSSPLSKEVGDVEDEWYIPYNGPYEPPPKKRYEQNRDSWGELLSDLLSEEEDSGSGKGASTRDARTSHAASAPEDRHRSRAISNASRQTRSTGAARASHLRSNPPVRQATMSYVDLSQLGGVGETPTPVERFATQSFPSTSPQRETPSSTSHRTSLASIFTFGRRKSLRLSSSMDNLARERAHSTVEPPLPTAPARPTPGRARAATTAVETPRGRMSNDDEYYHSYYSTLVATPAKDNGPSAAPESSLRSHPYAYPFPISETAEPNSAPPVIDKGKGRLVVPRITLLDPRGPKVPAYLKPSPRNSILKASISTPNLKGRQRWLTAETWCDALIFPRPRFAMRLADGAAGAPSGRIVSPPPSPVLPGQPSEPNSSIQERPTPAAQQVAFAKSRSTEASPTKAEGSKPAPSVPSQPEASTSKALRPPRPKSWAWDDLALPSPVPSLAKVLEDGKQLEAERKMWQAQAGRSFLDKRAHTISRARSRSIGASRSRPRPRSRSGERRAFEALQERTLLGNQTRPPTIHVHSASISRTSHSQTGTQSATGQGTFQSMTSYRPFSRAGTGSRSRSHQHSNSLGNTTSYKSSSDEATTGATGSSNGHSRSQSLGKSAFKLVVSTASNAAAFCGLAPDKNTITPMNERPDAMDSILQNPGTKVIRLQDQIRAEESRVEPDNLVVIGSPKSFGGRDGVSPAPSGVSGSGEGVGIAISPPDDHSRQYQGREPVRLPDHPYARKIGYTTLPVSALAAGASAAYNPPKVADSQPSGHLYAQPGHPYATARHHRPNDIRIPPNETMYAALTPDHIREVAPEDIQRYSPNVPTPTVVTHPTPRSRATPILSPDHPYVQDPKRKSELAFADALVRTMRRSIDSGLGTSDHGDDYEAGVDWRARTAEMSPEAANEIVRIHNVAGSSTDMGYLDSRPAPVHQRSGGMVSNHTVASSPMENIIPPAFRRSISGISGASFSTKLGTSSGSSPGLMSHESSPPLSPRPIDTTEDLERFQNLFYRPSHSNSSESMPRPESERPGPVSRSGSIPFDVSSRSTRSGFSTLARQLSEELEDLRHGYGSQDDLVEEPHMWGRRHGGLRGSRLDDHRDSDPPPHVVMARFASPSNSSPMSEYDSPLRLPIDHSFVSPSTNIPEDIESSRASSVLEVSPFNEEDRNELLRVGSIEAVSTPPIINTPHRFSTEPSLVGHGALDLIEERRDSGDYLDARVASERSTLLSPLSPNARSSYMTSNTDTSRMSGLSDFPVPPTVLPLATVADMSTTSLSLQPPRLEREPSHSTFGRQDSASDFGTIGEAL